MGEVYLAEDTKLKRQVALKFLPLQMTADPEAKGRFEREAQAAAALNHPNIVTIHEVGDHEGQVYIAMEYVDGQPLKDLIAASRTPSAPSTGTFRAVSRMPISQILDIVSQLASGLAAAHAKGIVHRDIKPQNIVIDANGRVKILDFGLAKLKGASPLSRESFTYGTVHYMSPEQGLGREVDSRSDIWSLGVVLFEMLAGALPFRGEYEQAVLYAIINEPAPSLPAEARRECPGLEVVVRRCLAKRREERYPSILELSADLEKSRPRETETPARRTRSRRRRRLAPPAAALLLSALVLVFLAVWARSPLRRALGLAGVPEARHIAVLPLRAGGGDAALLADGFSAVVIDRLTWIEGFYENLWTYPAGTAFVNRGRAPTDLRRRLGCNLVISGELRVAGSRLSMRLDLRDAASGRRLRRAELAGNAANLTLFQEGLTLELLTLLNLQRKEAALAHANAGGTSMPGAFRLYLKGMGALQVPGAATKAGQAIADFERALAQDERFTLARMALLDAWRGLAGEAPAPERLRQEADQWSTIRQTAGRWAPAWLAWGRLLAANGKTEEARAALRHALQLHGRSYDAQLQLAKSHAEAGASTEAEQLFKKAIGLRPEYPRALEELAYFFHLHGRFDEAQALYGRISRLTPGDPQAFCNLGAMHLLKGEKDRARRMFEKSYAIEPNSTARSNLALIYYYDGDYRRALPLHEAAARKSSEHYEWGNLGDTCRQIPGLQDRAAAAYRRAVDLAEKALAARPANPAEPLSCLALYYSHLGEKQRALAAIARARSLAPAFLPGIQRAILAYEAVQERSLALAALREYLERLGGMEDIEREPDLAALRRDPAYRKIAYGRP